MLSSLWWLGSIDTLRLRQNGHYSQKTFRNAFPWMKMNEFRLRFHWIWFLRVQLTMFQNNVGSNNGFVSIRRQAWSEPMMVSCRIYASFGLNDLRPYHTLYSSEFHTQTHTEIQSPNYLITTVVVTYCMYHNIYMRVYIYMNIYTNTYIYIFIRIALTICIKHMYGRQYMYYVSHRWCKKCLW